MEEDHLIDIVDKNDKIVGCATKEEKFEEELISRNVVAFIKNKKGELIIVKRSPRKRSWPNRLDLGACGNVNCGESYEDAIRREVKEELSIECELKFIRKLYTEVDEKGKKRRYFTGVFTGTTSKKPKLSDELLDLQHMTIGNLAKKMNSDPNLFTPSFIREFNELNSYL